MTSVQGLRYEINYKNDSMSFPLVSAETVVLEANTNSALLTNITLMGHANYTIRITNDQEQTIPILIDSVVLIPDLEGSKMFKIGNYSIRDEMKRCWDHSMNSRTMQVLEDCQQIVFSTMAELFDGAKGTKNSYC